MLFLEGLSGAFFRPLVLSYGLAVLVSMVVALTVTPALCLLMLSRGKLVHRESPLLRVLKRGYHAVLTPARPAGRSPAMVTAGALVTWPARWSCPTLGSQLLPNFKERDFLMHWLTQPGTSVAEENRVSVLGLPGPAGDPGRAQLRLAHRPGAARRRGLRRRLRRELDQRRPESSTTTRRWRRCTRRSRTTRACTATCRPTCGSGSRRCSPGPASRSSCGSTAPTCRPCGTGRRRSRSAIADVDGVIDAHASLQTDLPHIEVEPDLAAARLYGLTPGDIRRQASTLIASEEVSDIYSGGRAYDVHVTSIPPRARQRHRRREPADRHPGRGAGHSSATWPTSGWRPTPTRSSAEGSRAGSTSAPT